VTTSVNNGARKYAQVKQIQLKVEWCMWERI